MSTTLNSTMKPKQNESKISNKEIQTFLSGGISGAIARTATAPFERIIILKQTKNSNYADKSVIRTLMNIYEKEGVKSYFKGNGTNVCRIFPFSAVELYTFEVYKSKINQFFGTTQNNNKHYLLAGALSGITAASLVYPLDLLRTLFASQVNTNEYKGIINSLIRIVRRDGFFSLYRGLGATLIGITPYTSLKLTFYQMMKNFYYSEGVTNSDFANLAFGGLAGCMAVSVTYPTDLIRRRLQISILNSNVKAGYFATFKSILATDGFLGLYAGLTATYCKLIPSTAITFMINEKLKLYFSNYTKY